MLELAVTLVVIVILAGVLLRALLRYEELAEKTAMELTVRNLRSGLQWRIADALLHPGSAQLGALAGANPVSWLQRPPEGYLGEHAGTPSAAARGGWYFDTRTRELAYRPALHFAFEAEPGAPVEIRWQVRALDPGDGGRPAQGFALVATTRYKWF